MEENQYIDSKFNNGAEKHYKYKDKYKPNTLYWGLGIENEVYLEFDKKISVTKNFFQHNHKRERYSVDYFSNYKKENITKAFKIYLSKENDDLIDLPLLLNAHSFTNTDQYNQPITLYTKVRKFNSKFAGEFLIDSLKKHNPYFRDTFGVNWLFDGDTIEFTTLNFFNAKLEDIINELEQSKTVFINNINSTFSEKKIYSDYGNLKIMDTNHGFAIHMTNLDNISMFNNGTLHYNITLPIKLDSNAIIKDYKQFIKIHQQAIKYIQWLEPFLIAIYGAPDPFYASYNGYKFTASSQRCAVSRYISIGTYDSDKMERGKILTKKIDLLDLSRYKYWWYDQYHNTSGYTKLEEIGLDINFNKHYNHGIELRIFDHISDPNKLKESMEFLIFLMDFSLVNKKPKYLTNPIYERTWNELVIGVLEKGSDYILSDDEKDTFDKLFETVFTNNTVKTLYYEIFDYLRSLFTKKRKMNKKYYIKPSGPFSSLVLDNKIIGDIDDENIHLELNNRKRFKCCYT